MAERRPRKRGFVHGSSCLMSSSGSVALAWSLVDPMAGGSEEVKEAWGSN